MAAQQLRERGYQAFSLAGGMKAWSLAWNTADLSLTQQESSIIQVRRVGKGCLSYLIGSQGQAAVMDAALDPEIYLELARQRGWQISHVFDTHIHADHLSRGRFLAEASGAEYYLPSQDRVSYSFTAVIDEEEFPVGSVHIKALRTPGHTMESTCFLIGGEALITGDTLFLASVGRPDLKANLQERHQRAHLLFDSLQRLLTLPGDTRILPGHASQPVPFDGQALAAPLSLLRRQISLLSLAEDDFVEALLQRIPETPPNHLRIVELNEAGAMPDSDITDLEAGGNRCAAG